MACNRYIFTFFTLILIIYSVLHTIVLEIFMPQIRNRIMFQISNGNALLGTYDFLCLTRKILDYNLFDFFLILTHHLEILRYLILWIMKFI
jgi:hypothetical protein